ncbi:MAG: TetR/AcrR family transcriptional regulator [Mycobacterium sp.]|nr:TetR/AcrR family transcriptional regulator [Mycobacterium sp.]
MTYPGGSVEMAGRMTTSEAISAAALAEFVAFGYRRTSVESIARRAQLSRATVYAHCTGKEELFRALVSRLHDEHLAEMREAADAPGLDIKTRITRLLAARFLRFVELTSSSPHAAELYDRHGALCGDIAEEAHRTAEKIITAVLRQAVAAGEIDLGRSGLTVAQLAGVLNDCAFGAKGEDPATATPAAFTARLGHSVAVITAGIASADAVRS